MVRSQLRRTKQLRKRGGTLVGVIRIAMLWPLHYPTTSSTLVDHTVSTLKRSRSFQFPRANSTDLTGACPLWPKADIAASNLDVRFTPPPKSGHVQRKRSCPLYADSGHAWVMSWASTFGQYCYWGSAPARGRTIFISVNSPGCVSTSIEPPCCFTTMS